MIEEMVTRNSKVANPMVDNKTQGLAALVGNQGVIPAGNVAGATPTKVLDNTRKMGLAEYAILNGVNII